MNSAPTGRSAWRRLLAAMARPRLANNASMRPTMAGSRSKPTPITAAIASREMSSWVGPRPPHTITASLTASSVRRAVAMRSRLSPTWTWRWESMPAKASRSPMKAELLSTTWPSSNSVPTASTEHENGRGGAAGAARRPRPPQSSRTTCRPSWRYWIPVTRVIPTASHTAKSTKAR